MYIKKLILSELQLKLLSFFTIQNKKYFLLGDANTGQKYLEIPENVSINKIKNIIVLKAEDNNKELINFFANFFLKSFKNLNKYFVKKLILKGLGFRITKTETDTQTVLRFKLGLSHLLDHGLPKNKLIVKVRKNIIHIKSKDFAFLGNSCKRIKNLKLPNIYNGKGFWYKNEKITLKTFKKK